MTAPFPKRASSAVVVLFDTTKQRLLVAGQPGINPVGKGSGSCNIGYNITSFDIDSAPILVDKNNLPKAIKN